MALESVTYITDLVKTNPTGSDAKSQGDDHIRNIKKGLENTFANFTGVAMNADESELNILEGATLSTSELNILDGLKNEDGSTEAVTADVNDAIEAGQSGLIKAWPTNTAPNGYLECDGSAVSRTTYADLFSVIASKYGNGDGSTTFNLPDFRGYFLRGYDNTAGNDPDAASRTDRGDGTTGDNVGTKQAEAFKQHNHGGNTGSNNASQDVKSHENDRHIATGVANGSGNSSDVIDITTANDEHTGNGNRMYTSGGNHTHTISNAGGNETRPINVSVMWVIKT